MPPSRVVCLSNCYDQTYHDIRGEEINRALSSTKRRDLFRCLELATGRKVLVLSFPPKAARRRTGRWLAPMETRFGSHRQLFSASWDIPKLRLPASWLFYPWHVIRQVRSGDVILLDNYEFIYVLAAWITRLFCRVSFVLDYEDGKHAIDRGWPRLLSALAETLGRPLIGAAVLAHPALGQRLPPGVPTLLVPGFVTPAVVRAASPPPSPVRLLYSGTLDYARGTDLLLSMLAHLPAEGWELHITGDGPLGEEIRRAADQANWRNRLHFHGVLPSDDWLYLVQTCHVGLNCQRASDPVSAVTFPSKVFSYLSAGLLVVSSRASGVEEVCGQALCYFDGSPEGLAMVLKPIIADLAPARQQHSAVHLTDRYSVAGTAARLKEWWPFPPGESA